MTVTGGILQAHYNMEKIKFTLMQVANKFGWSKWVYPTDKYLFKCCDCGLVHELQFKTFVKKNEKRGTFEVIELPKEIRVMFRARRKK